MKKTGLGGIFLLLSCLVLGCTTTTDNPAAVLESVLSDTDEQIFVGDSMEANYDPNVIMKRAESYFEKGSYPEAIVEYKHFLDLHRSHVLAPYAQYKIGLTHFKRFKTIDRDPEPIEESLVAFETLISEFPNSRYEEEARQKIIACHEYLAAHHLLVGKFYFNKDSYLAAAYRYEKVIDAYPEIEAAADAKYQLAMTYHNLGAQEWAADWLVDFVQHHPENKYYDDGMEMLADMQEEFPEILIAKYPSPDAQPGLGILSAGYQNGNLTNESSPVPDVSSPSPIPVAYQDSPPLSSGVNGHSSAAVHTITENALCSLGSWCESTPASFAITASPTTKICHGRPVPQGRVHFRVPVERAVRDVR